MPRYRALIAASLALPWLLVGGCRIEQTPDEYLDYEDSIETEREVAGAELRDRLRAFVASVARGDPAEALISLHPAEDVLVVGPMEALDVRSADGARALLSRLAPTPVAVRLRDVTVETGPNANVAWFSLLLEAPGSTPEPALYRATGLYLRDGGLWTLMQAHIAGPLIPPTQPQSSQPETDADPEAGE